jgi:hypothetical protein
VDHLRIRWLAKRRQGNATVMKLPI